ncbi:MAG: bifunctional glutamate N-acetyltransferase/amino-acid acetyltransferase ArgJ, partial [Gammaproteobacteria bacterium]
MPPVPGVALGTAAAGLRYQGRDDLLLVRLAPGSTVAAMFTRNAFAAAPVLLAREHLARARPRLLLVNAGQANAGLGERGLADARACCAAAAALEGLRPEEVLPYSTGVIGEPLPVERLVAALPRAREALREEGWEAAARAILTTDTRPKLASRTVGSGSWRATLTGMVKGAGMIRPDMIRPEMAAAPLPGQGQARHATLLAFLATDAALAPELAAELLEEAVAGSFHCLTVDGDTSTNDACTLVASGRAGPPPDADALAALRRGLRRVCEELARAVARDGEGATRLVTIEVGEARDEAEARQVAFTVAHSPLVKTALFAADPNWGRILAAVGRAGVEGLAVEGVRLYAGAGPEEVCLARGGARSPDYDEGRARAAL